MRWKQVLGWPEHTVSWREQLIAVLTALAGMWLLASFGHAWQDSSQSGLVLVASIGASAVLVFAVPHGVLSQPWSVIGGQVSSAVVGVLVVSVLGASPLSAALAVSLAIAVMHLLRCLHPPGGATALSVVLATGAGVRPDWSFVLSPVLWDAVLIVLAGIVLNAAFPWRRYPAAWRQPARLQDPAIAARSQPVCVRQVRQRQAVLLTLTPEQIRAAFAEIDTPLDITDEDAAALHDALTRQQQSRS